MARRKQVTSRDPEREPEQEEPEPEQEPEEEDEEAEEETSQEEPDDSEDEEKGNQSEEESVEEKRNKEKGDSRVQHSQVKQKAVVEKIKSTAQPTPASPPSPNAADFTVKPMSLSRRDTKPSSKRKSQVQKEVLKEVRNNSKKVKTGGEKAEKVSASVSGSTGKVWSEEDEITVLEGMIDYQKGKGIYAGSDMVSFHEFIRENFKNPMSKTQLYEKIRRLKKKFFNNVEKAERYGEDPVFPNAHESKLFELSKRIWGPETNIHKEDEKKSRATEVVKGKGEKKDEKKSRATEVVKGKGEKKDEKKSGSTEVVDVNGDNKDEKKGGATEVVKVKEEKKDALAAKGKKKDAADTDDVMNAGGDFESMFPYLSQSYDMSKFSFLQDYLRCSLKENMSLLSRSKAKELDDKWKTLSDEEAGLFYRKLGLLGEHTELVLNALK